MQDTTEEEPSSKRLRHEHMNPEPLHAFKYGSARSLQGSTGVFGTETSYFIWQLALHKHGIVRCTTRIALRNHGSEGADLVCSCVVSCYLIAQAVTHCVVQQKSTTVPLLGGHLHCVVTCCFTLPACLKNRQPCTCSAQIVHSAEECAGDQLCDAQLVLAMSRSALQHAVLHCVALCYAVLRC